MRKLPIVLALALTCLLVPKAAHAQPRGGGILDFIAKLSGPRMIGPAISIATGGEEVRFRGSLAYRVSFASDDVIDPDGANIDMWSLQPTVEVPLGRYPFDLTGGVALHRFGGDADPFTHVSFPVYVQSDIPLTAIIRLRAGVGFHHFPDFEAGDFAPLTVDLDDSGDGAVFAAYLGLDFIF